MANDLTRNTSLIYDDVRMCKSKKKEDALKASTQVWQKGVRIYVRYGNVGYNKVTDGISTFSSLPEIGGGTPGGDDASTLNGQNGAYYRARANHTGTQAISTVAGLQGALDGKATVAQGTKADTSIQPSDTSDVSNAGKVVKYSNIGAVNTATPQFPENAVPLSYFDAGLSTKQNTLSNPSQAEAEAGTATTARSWSAQRDRQAIVAASRQTVPVSANKTLALTDEYTYQRVTAAATITIPTNASVAFPVGAEIDFFQAGAGAITFSPSSGVTVNSFEDTLVTDGKGAAATLKKVATNEWDLII